jgi:hypothetical protein
LRLAQVNNDVTLSTSTNIATKATKAGITYNTKVGALLYKLLCKPVEGWRGRSAGGEEGGLLAAEPEGPVTGALLSQ